MYEQYTKTVYFKSYTTHEFYYLKNNNLRLVYRFHIQKGKYGYTKFQLTEIALDKTFYRENDWQDAKDFPEIKDKFKTIMNDIKKLETTYYKRWAVDSTIIENTHFI